MNIEKGNIFGGIPDGFDAEIFEDLVETAPLKLERILSDGQATPAGEWYDQERHEWVILLQGSAGLRFKGLADIVELTAGDFVHIPAHQKHRVEWTDRSIKCVWLALHYSPE